MSLASSSGSPPNPAHRPGPDPATAPSPDAAVPPAAPVPGARRALVLPARFFGRRLRRRIDGAPVLLRALGHLLVDPDGVAAGLRETMGRR